MSDAGVIPTRNWSDGHVRGVGEHQLGLVPSRSAPRTAPATSAPSAAASSTRSTAVGRRGSRVRDHRPLRRQLRHRRHRRAREVQRAVRRAGAWTPSPPAASSASPWTSPRRASRTSACASARSRATSRRPSSSRQREGIGAELALGSRDLAAEVRRARAGDGGQEPRAAGLRPARLVRHEPRLRHVRPRRLPHALVPDRATRSSPATLPPDTLEGKA